MEKITSLISEKENILLLLSCLASVVAAFLSLISVRNTIKASNTLKRRIRKQYMNQYIHRYSKVTEDELDRKLAIILAEIDSNIEKALKNKDIEYSMSLFGICLLIGILFSIFFGITVATTSYDTDSSYWPFIVCLSCVFIRMPVSGIIDM